MRVKCLVNEYNTVALAMARARTAWMGWWSMVGLSPELSSLVFVYTWAERGFGRVNFLAYEHSAMPPAQTA